MAYFAKIVNGEVENIVVAEQDWIDKQPGTWIEYKYNMDSGKVVNDDGTEASDQTGALRANTPCPGWKYDSTNDVFVEPQPYASWTLNNTTYRYDPPIARPDNDQAWWDEDVYQADTGNPKTKGWIIPE